MTKLLSLLLFLLVAGTSATDDVAQDHSNEDAAALLDGLDIDVLLRKETDLPAGDGGSDGNSGSDSGGGGGDGNSSSSETGVPSTAWPSVLPSHVPTATPTEMPSVAPTATPTNLPTLTSSTAYPSIAKGSSETDSDSSDGGGSDSDSNSGSNSGKGAPTSTQCSFNWKRAFWDGHDRRTGNEDWMAWAQLHFPRETTDCPQGSTCWAGLYCERGAAPSNPCAYSTTELCMLAGNRNDTGCKVVHMVQCPCESDQGLGATLTASMRQYNLAYGQEWRAQHPEGSDGQFKEACEESQSVSLTAKQLMLACVRRKCADAGNKFLQLTAGFGGGAYC